MNPKNFIIQSHGCLILNEDDFEINYSLLNYLDVNTTSRSRIAIIDNVPDLNIFCTTKDMIKEKYNNLKRKIVSYTGIPSQNIEIYTESITTSYNFLPLPGNIDKAMVFFASGGSTDITGIYSTDSMKQACLIKSINCICIHQINADYKDVPNSQEEINLIAGYRDLQRELERDVIQGDNFVTYPAPPINYSTFL